MTGWVSFVDGYPINRVDPLGLFDDAVIQKSLSGKPLNEIFGSEPYGLTHYDTYSVARWGLYNLLRDAKDFDRITLRYVDFGYSGDPYPLASDTDGSWTVRSECGSLFFSNSRWGKKISLDGFMTILSLKAQNNSDPYLSDKNKWWRPATSQFHWYDLNGRFYSNFYHRTDLPDLFIIGGSFRQLGGASLLTIHDRYGNQYVSVSAGGGFGISYAEAWEGYASLTAYVPLSQRFTKVLDERTLRQIIEGWDITFSGSTGTVGIGISLWNTGSIALFGGTNGNVGILGSIGYTWYTGKDLRKRWSWIDEDIPMYGPPN